MRRKKKSGKGEEMGEEVGAGRSKKKQAGRFGCSGDRGARSCAARGN